MNPAILLAIALMLGGCATTIPGVQISDEERAACATQGCTVWTRAELEALVIEAMRRGVEAARKQRSSI